MGTLQRFTGDTTTEVTSHSASSTPMQRRKTIAGGAVSFTLGETPLSDITKNSITSDHMTSVTKGSHGELAVTRKGSLKRGESEDTINGDDQNGAGDTVTLSEETVHDLEKEDDKIVTNIIDPVVEGDTRSDADKTAPDVEWTPLTRCVQ